MSTTRRTLLGAVAATVPLAGCAGAWEGVEEDVSGDENASENESTELENPAALEEADEVVAVGPGPNTEFDPDSLVVDPDTVVGFRWDSGGHTIDVRSQPEDADWQGVPRSQDAGHVHVHTFQARGRYDYHCGAHQSQPDEEAQENPNSEGEAQILVGVDPEDVEDEGSAGNESGGNESGDGAEGDNPESDQPQSPDEGATEDGGNETDS